ncbi:MAG: cobyrinate a,c-diamide synthase [Nitrospirota bacterium]
MSTYPRLTIAGIRGGGGKTTLALSLIAVLRRQKGLKVVPFKKGPDYIDAGWMSVAAQHPCYNLDPFLISKERIVDSFLAHASGDIAVIEGNRGLYDGMDADGSYSTAELAKLLKSPVVLIVDCTKVTRTTAALVLGCMLMDREVDLKGVVLNQIAGSRHESVIRASIEKYCSVPVLGAIPKLSAGDLPERHMGLTPYHEYPDTEKAMALLEDIAKNYLDIEKVLGIASGAEPLHKSESGSQNPEVGKYTIKSPSLSFTKGGIAVRIGVIRDAAFQFYYPENLEELEKSGAEVVDINALADSHIPDIDALYIGGGFPETNAIDLAENTRLREAVRTAAEEGLPIYAECGGLMFLGDAIVVDGVRYPMVGIFPITFEMRKKPQAHGYTIVEVERENPFYPVGTILQGHEFHYSAVVSMEERKDIRTAFLMQRGAGIRDKRDGIFYKNVFATYTHLHALGSPAWSEGLIAAAKHFKESKG